MNQISVIRPYRYHHCWVFDDPDVGLVREALVAGVDTMLDTLCDENLLTDTARRNGIMIMFSGGEFPGADIQLDRVEERTGGNVYRWRGRDMEGWLCPALFRYFDVAPEVIWVQARFNQTEQS